ncbi:MAG: hypothetical protein ACJ74Y_18360 [Bryobacteraceae bacterium]
MNTFWKTLIVSAAVLTSVQAQDRRNSTQQQSSRGSTSSQSEKARSSSASNDRPYYDSKHRDWHQWNDREDQSYTRYADEHHRKTTISRRAMNENSSSIGTGDISMPTNIELILLPKLPLNLTVFITAEV